MAIAAVASLSQNVIPVHIAFIPLLISPLLPVFDRLRIDRRGVASALTFSLQAPYMLIPAGFGSYRRPWDYRAADASSTAEAPVMVGAQPVVWEWRHTAAMLAMVAALAVQLTTESLVLAV